MSSSFIGNILKTRRKELNLSVKDVLEQLQNFGIDISDKTLYGWENGHRQPDADTFLILCNIYQISTITGIQKIPKRENDETIEKAPSNLSEEAYQVAQDYSQLDQPGKNVVRVVIQEEGKRVKAEKEKRQIPAFEPQTVRRIPLYFTPAAAGMMSPAEGQDYEMIEVGKDVPWNADFAVKIDGESMEPYIRDGSTVYVNREPLENGDVGIFYVDGNMICKQYYKDEDGNVRLLSLNRACRYADRYISVKDTDTVMMYYGRVLLPRRPMVSWA